MKPSLIKINFNVCSSLTILIAAYKQIKRPIVRKDVTMIMNLMSSAVLTVAHIDLMIMDVIMKTMLIKLLLVKRNFKDRKNSFVIN